MGTKRHIRLLFMYTVRQIYIYKNFRLHEAFCILFGILLFGTILFITPWNELLPSIRSANWKMVSIAILLGWFSTIIRSIRYCIVFNFYNSFLSVLGVFSTTRLINYALPFRTGEIATLVILKRYGVSPGILISSPTWFLFKVSDFAALLIIGAFVAVFSTHMREYSNLLIASAFFLVVLLFFIPKLIKIAVQKLLHCKFSRSLNDFLVELEISLSNQSYPNLLIILLSSLLIWGFNISMSILVFYSFGMDVETTKLLFVSVFANLLDILPLRSPMGLGTSDAAWIGLLKLFSVNFDMAIIVNYALRASVMMLLLLEFIAGGLILLRNKHAFSQSGHCTFRKL